MSADVQILAAGTAAAPVDYTVPNAQEMIPLAINADIDGSGTASAYVPTLEIISDGGVVIARVPTKTTVTAGVSCEVTWAPFLGDDEGTVVNWPNSSYGSTIIAGTPFAYYPLDDTTLPVVVDHSGNGHNLSNPYAASVLNVRGLIATSTDGALYLPLGADASKSPFGAANWTPNRFSAEAWIQNWSSDAINEICTYMRGNAASDQKFQLRLNLGHAEFQCFDAASTAYGATGVVDLRDGKTHHIVGTYDGATVCVYVDGALAGSLAAVFTPTAINGNIGVGGAQPLLSGSNIDGIIDEAAFYSYALTATDVANHYAKATSV